MEFNVKKINKASSEIWNYYFHGNLKKCFYRFREIHKLMDMLTTYGYRFKRIYEQGGVTVIFIDDDGTKLGCARENCVSDGAAMDLIEVYGLYGEKTDRFDGFLDCNEVYSLFMNSFRKYKNNKKYLISN